MTTEPATAARRSAYPWRQFVILGIAGWLGILAVIPYQLALLPASATAGRPMALLVLSGALNGALEVAVAVGIGLLAARAVGLRAPVSEALAYRGDVGAAVRGLSPVVAAMLGAAGSVVVIVLDLTLFHGISASMTSNARSSPGPLLGFLASFEGGITEELLLRLLVMSVIAWVLSRIWRTMPPAIFWTANIAAAVLFGLGHLPATAALVALTPIVITRAVVLNGVVGVVAGWLYWRRGLESAMIAHFSADLVLHVLLAA